MKLQFIIVLTLRSRSGEIRAELNNTPKPILEKGTTQIKAGFANSLPQSAGDCKPLDWNDFDGFFLANIGDWRSRGKIDLRVPRATIWISQIFSTTENLTYLPFMSAVGCHQKLMISI